MDIAKLFNPFALGPNIEVIKPRLPESVRMNWGPMNWGDRDWGDRDWGAPGLADFARPGRRHDAPPGTLHTAHNAEL